MFTLQLVLRAKVDTTPYVFFRSIEVWALPAPGTRIRLPLSFAPVRFLKVDEVIMLTREERETPTVFCNADGYVELGEVTITSARADVLESCGWHRDHEHRISNTDDHELVEATLIGLDTLEVGYAKDHFQDVMARVFAVGGNPSVVVSDDPSLRLDDSSLRLVVEGWMEESPLLQSIPWTWDEGASNAENINTLLSVLEVAFSGCASQMALLHKLVMRS